MSVITVVLPYSSLPSFGTTLQTLLDSPVVGRVLVLHAGEYTEHASRVDALKVASPWSSAAVASVVRACRSEFILVVTQSHELQPGQSALERMTQVARQTGAGLLYADYYEVKKGVRSERPLIDYQEGSLRDNFEFGPMMLFRTQTAKRALKAYGVMRGLSSAGLYDLRLKVSILAPVFHLQEYLYTKVEADLRASGEKIFDYVDPKNRAVQLEMEKVVTQHLKHIGAYLPPSFSAVPKDTARYPVEASVVIPVRNRERTIADAVNSILRQRTSFAFNVIVVDNHSTDMTTGILKRLAANDPRVHHIVPERQDLAIGGCWNEAVRSEQCGRFAVQLDSDDIYSGVDTLERIVGGFSQKNVAMVIGSYKLVNMQLEELPPGLIDHREWTPKNGRNNALRINGLGAPRAFRTSLLRQEPIPNVSYGEDYAIALRLSREYQIGRIYDPLYLCRRWEGNTDAALSVEKANRNDLYKDRIRTIELLARKQYLKKR